MFKETIQLLWRVATLSLKGPIYLKIPILEHVVSESSFVLHAGYETHLYTGLYGVYPRKS